MPQDRSTFRREYFGKWDCDPVRVYFDGLLAEYNERCEAYDRTVCTGQPSGIAIPRTGHESTLINQHARNLTAELMARASEKYRLTATQVDAYWHEARKPAIAKATQK